MSIFKTFQTVVLLQAKLDWIKLFSWIFPSLIVRCHISVIFINFSNGIQFCLKTINPKKKNIITKKITYKTFFFCFCIYLLTIPKVIAWLLYILKMVFVSVAILTKLQVLADTAASRQGQNSSQFSTGQFTT